MNIPELLNLPLEKLEELVQIKKQLLTFESETSAAPVRAASPAPRPAAPVPNQTRRPMSPEARARLSEKLKARWAERRADEGAISKKKGK